MFVEWWDDIDMNNDEIIYIYIIWCDNGMELIAESSCSIIFVGV